MEDLPLDDTPTGQARLWTKEFAAARDALKKFHEQGETVIRKFLDEREDTDQGDTRYNIFKQLVSTQLDMLQGNLPRTSADRMFSDASDDVARVGGVILERIMNADIERSEDTFAEAAWNALEDYRLPGLGMVRWRYVFEEAPVLDEMGAQVMGLDGKPEMMKVSEDCESDYVHWRDALWSPARTPANVRWWAFANYMSKDELTKRFGKAAEGVKLETGKERDDNGKPSVTPWGRAKVWEIWCKKSKSVYWFVEGHGSLLESKPDPLGLKNFWPFPKPMVANKTTTKFIPKADWFFSKDLYNEINEVSARIKLLQEAIRVAGAYDKKNSGLKNILSTKRQNILVPIEDWGSFAASGGFKGVIDWVPLDQVVAALTILRDYRRELIETANQLTGMADVMRGQAMDAGKTATATRIEARSGSVRIRSVQDEFARFCSDALRIKAEIIAKHFDAETIAKRSNIEKTPDARFAQQAIALIKEDVYGYRINVKPESISMTDFDAQKAERLEVLDGVAGAMQRLLPVVDQVQGSLPTVLKVLQWAVSGLKGAKEIEGVFDQAVQAAEQAALQPAQEQPDPKERAEQMKLQGQQMKNAGELQKIQAQTQAKAVEAQIDVEAKRQMEENQRLQNVQELRERQAITRLNPVRNGEPKF